MGRTALVANRCEALSGNLTTSYGAFTIKRDDSDRLQPAYAHFVMRLRNTFEREESWAVPPRPAHGPLGWITEKVCGIFVANSADCAGFADSSG